MTGEINPRKTRKIFQCKVCHGDRLAEHFANDLNDAPVRDLRLVCCRCAAGFNRLPLADRREFLFDKINDYYGEKQYIYALCEPETEVVRYIGRSSRPKARFTAHLQLTRDFARQTCIFTTKPKFSCDCETHKRANKLMDTKRWITKLLAADSKPIMKIVEEVAPGRLVHEREVRNICQYIKEDFALLNYENQSRKARKMIKNADFSFMDVDIEELESSGFLREFEINLSFDVSHESGWRRALILHRIFSTDVDLKFDESNHWDKN